MYKILVVEDDYKIQELVVELLLSRNYEVKFASSGIEGLYIYQNELFDLVITDLMMPHIDGYGFIDRIREYDSKTKIIVLSALDQEETQLKGFDLGIDDYICKPFSTRVFLKRVEACLSRL
ncbi:response regulator transcription factor [Mycoplasma sp. P36-A1]|uniref:response regulator transcription factor n=1 Tax=Mycoplasma sp. P36-A1 TaxID=3252900 RepID=UPI003C2DC4CF